MCICYSSLTSSGNQKISCHIPSNTQVPFSSLPECSYARNILPKTAIYEVHRPTKVHELISETNKSSYSP